MRPAWAVGAVGAFLTGLLFEVAKAWADAVNAQTLPTLLLLMAYVGLGAAAGHAAVSLTGGRGRAWPAILLVMVVGGALLGWGEGAGALHPQVPPLAAALGGLACAGAGGWLGVVLPNPYSRYALEDDLAGADDPTVELRVPGGGPTSDPRPGGGGRWRPGAVAGGWSTRPSEPLSSPHWLSADIIENG